LLLSAPYVGEHGRHYAFYSVARDNAGAVELPPAVPDATTTVVTETAVIVDRMLFYNNSIWDGYDPAAGASDDGAIATDKQVLQAGSPATVQNVSNYVHGVNGVMIDVAGFVGEPTAADFSFRVGNDDFPNAWTTAPVPLSVTVRPGEGMDGSDRITIVWSDGAIQNEWLEITIRAFDGFSGIIGLTDDEVFYIGSAVGETGDVESDFRVDVVDRNVVANNFAAGVSIENPYDVDRDGDVDADDVGIVESNFTGLTGDLNKDDVVNLVDLAITQSSLGGSDGDLTGDGSVSRADVARMARSFGEAAPAEMLARRLALISLVESPSPSATPTVDVFDEPPSLVTAGRRERREALRGGRHLQANGAHVDRMLTDAKADMTALRRRRHDESKQPERRFADHALLDEAFGQSQ
jgi:hypothetical protein